MTGEVTLDEAQAALRELIERLGPGEGLLITRDNRPVARLVGLAPDVASPVPGRGRGMLTIVSDDDEHWADWADYLP
ncbi:MAG TPA: hypothetical protein VG406_21480 [Isosphaeraceae bacterium]|jgi:antitoxin (DNA-binding transcriptional repressor) of toxin-antitoxin stability system|nr:hypothetical protein [Isosphaeraceae bacterium]